MPHRNDPSRQLCSALNEGSVQEICQIISKYPHTVNTRDQSHGLQTLLMRICHVRVDQSDRDVILNMARMKDPNPNIQDSAGRTALCHACIAEKTDVIAFLSSLENCDPDIPDEDGNTALLYATKSQKVSVVEALINGFSHRGIDANHANNKGICALKEAENRCSSDICRLLINDAGADTSVLDRIQLPRDPRIPGTPRTPTPDHVTGRSPQMARKRHRGHVSLQNGALKPEGGLTPLVIPSRSRLPATPGRSPLTPGRSQMFPLPSRPYGESRGYGDYTEGYGESRGAELEVPRNSPLEEDRTSLPDVVEADEDEGVSEGSGEESFDEGYHGPRRRKNSLSLPDLRDGGMVRVTSTPSSSNSGYDEGFHSSSTKADRRSTQFTLEELPLARVSEQEEYDHRSVPSGKSRLTQRRPSASLPDLRDQFSLVGTSASTAYSRKSNRRSHKNSYNEPEVPMLDTPSSTDSEGMDPRGRQGERLSLSHGDGSLRLPQLNINTQLTSSLPVLPKSLRVGFAGNRRPSLTSLALAGDERRSLTLHRESTELQLELRGSKVQGPEQ